MLNVLNVDIVSEMDKVIKVFQENAKIKTKDQLGLNSEEAIQKDEIWNDTANAIIIVMSIVAQVFEVQELQAEDIEP